MLNKIEKKIMKYFYNRCVNKESCLINPEDIKISLLPDIEITNGELDKVVNNLIYDGYIDLVLTDNKGLPIYCVSLKEKGEAFLREVENEKRNIIQRLSLTVILAFVSFFIGCMLKLIFKW